MEEKKNEVEEKIVYKNTPLTYLFVASPIVIIVILCLLEIYL